MSIEWPLVLFTLIAGSGGAVLAYAGVGEFTQSSNKNRFNAAAIGVALLIVGGICSVLHLGHPANFMAAVGHLGSFSGISVELILLGLIVVCGAIYAASLKKEDGQGGASKALGAICIVLGVVFAFMCGMSYVIEAKPAWDTIMLPLNFLFSCMAVGGFLYLLLKPEGDSGDDSAVVKLTLAVSVIAAICAFVYGAMAYSNGGSEAIAYFVIAGCGGVLAAAMAYMLTKSPAAKGKIALGLVGALACALFIRMFMWAAATGWIDAFEQASANRGMFFF